MKGIVFWALVMVCGCGGEPAPPENAQELCVEISEAACDRADRCGVLEGDVDVQVCVSAVIIQCCAEAGAPGPGVGGCNDIPVFVGRGQVDTCTDHIVETVCAEDRTPQSCKGLIPGTGSDGPAF